MTNNNSNCTLSFKNWNIEEITGYKPLTTLYMDFSIADKFGIEAIKDTYNRAFKGLKRNYKYLTEMVMVLNWKIWEHYKTNEYYAKVYDNLWRKLDDWCHENFTEDQKEYYFETTD